MRSDFNQPKAYDPDWDESKQSAMDGMNSLEMLSNSVYDYITEDDEGAKMNIATTLWFVLQSNQEALFDSIKVEKEWKRDSVFDAKVAAWNERNAGSFTGGFIASVEQLESALAEGKISKEAPWFWVLKQKLDTVNILMKVKV
jgi:hypothetical protein